MMKQCHGFNRRNTKMAASHDRTMHQRVNARRAAGNEAEWEAESQNSNDSRNMPEPEFSPERGDDNLALAV